MVSMAAIDSWVEHQLSALPLLVHPGGWGWGAKISAIESMPGRRLRRSNSKGEKVEPQRGQTTHPEPQEQVGISQNVLRRKEP